MDQGDKQNLLVAAVVIAMIVGAYWLITTIHRNGKLEECLMARRRNCEQFSGR